MDFIPDLRLNFSNPLPLFFTLLCIYGSISLERLTLYTIQALLETLELEYLSVEFVVNMAARCPASNVISKMARETDASSLLLEN